MGILIMSVGVGALALEDGHHKKNREGFHVMMAKHLDLTDKQQKEIKALTRNQKEKRHHIKKQIKKGLMQLNPDDSNYEQQLEIFAEEKSVLIKEDIIRQGQTRAKIHAILTPEQRVKAKEIMGKMDERHHKKMQEKK